MNGLEYFHMLPQLGTQSVELRVEIDINRREPCASDAQDSKMTQAKPTGSLADTCQWQGDTSLKGEDVPMERNKMTSTWSVNR